MNKNKALHPEYVVILDDIQGWFFSERRESRSDFSPSTMNAQTAIKIVAAYEILGRKAMAYHYSWKERGFRKNEESCKELCRNKYWRK